MVLFWSDLENSCGLFSDDGRNPVTVQVDNDETSSHHDDVSSLSRYLPLGTTVQCLLGTLLCLSVGQDSHLPIQPVLHVIHIHDSSTFLRLDTLDHTYTPTVSFTTHGFHGESLDYRHGTILMWTTPVDSSLGPLFGDPKRGR